jgi:carbonic anhydrase
LAHENIEKRIESNKLRLILPRRACIDTENRGCFYKGRPPVADFPNYSSTNTHNSDLLNLDIKVPGEHQMFNETFDAEIQFLHIHLTASRFGQIGLPVKATPDGYNDKFQTYLDQFQLVYNRNKAACGVNQRRRRGETVAEDDVAEPVALVDDEGFQRRLQNATSTQFNPYGDLIPTHFFYRYEGSSTEPPCMSMTWFVMIHPLIISRTQLEQVKRLIFTNVDDQCVPTSVHNIDQSVARPIQPLGNDRPVMFCKDGAFDPDDPLELYPPWVGKKDDDN